ncbi:HNH endonuclease [Roseofilum casamattae]|uniref:HNH endonuclease n=1 Tax=Roseofilum casamattae BLCC-M143 TaxID=3022442 RepID=A0ABT7C008_9CYAN|nr:HNH endonuclease [Roseofilum casamattae]MDJ1184756.1 HNH endonuclease [Roseofilum casamattae BLCC-M143]
MTSATHVLSQSVVVFSKNYLPVSRIDMKRAISLLVTGKAEPLDLGNGQAWIVRSPSLVLKVPEHIRLTFAGGERIWKIPPVNRKELLRRDKHMCQYCGARKNLTIDHVIPRSRGGQHTWDNVAIACGSCNSRKGDRTPAEAGLKLRTQPKAPMHPAVAFAEQFWRTRQMDLDAYGG